MRSEPRSARTPVWALSISLAATLEIDVSFSSSGYLDVSVHRVPFHNLCIGLWILEVCSSGFPHSDICGSLDICSSPQLFAAYHVFLRLLVPRHPPYALSCLTSVKRSPHIRSVVYAFLLLSLDNSLSVFQQTRRKFLYYRICFDVLLNNKWLIISSLYEVLKVHQTSNLYFCFILCPSDCLNSHIMEELLLPSYHRSRCFSFF